MRSRQSPVASAAKRGGGGGGYWGSLLIGLLQGHLPGEGGRGEGRSVSPDGERCCTQFRSWSPSWRADKDHQEEQSPLDFV